MKDQYQHVANAVLGTPLFIREAEGRVITSLVRQRMAGESLSADEIRIRVEHAQAQQGPRSGPRIEGTVEIVPIYGVILPRASMFTEMSGATSVAAIRQRMEAALRNEDVTSIVAEIDSPGGSAEGIEELATWIRAQRGQKRMTAVVNYTCCSAAYYLAAQFDEIVASPSSLTGNIGVFFEHTEFSKANEMAGITTTIIRLPENKHDINDSEPLSDGATLHLEQIAGDYYGQFCNAVAKGRGTNAAAVRAGFGQGRELTADRAKEAQLVDRVDTLENTVRRLQPRRPQGGRANAQGGLIDFEAMAGPDSDLPFAERRSLVSAAARDLVGHARARADMRSREGRDLSSADRTDLLATADSLRELAGPDVVEESADPPEPETPVAVRRNGRLELEQARAQYGI